VRLPDLAGVNAKRALPGWGAAIMGHGSMGMMACQVLLLCGTRFEWRGVVLSNGSAGVRALARNFYFGFPLLYHHAVQPFELLAETLAPDGAVMKLVRRGDEYIILADGATLMSSRAHGSEEALATLACQGLASARRASVLVGGLGMGFTARAALDLLAGDATVVVVELVAAVVEWNRGSLGALAGHPLKDRRVRVEIGDVTGKLRSSWGQFDAVLLDVDNGPAAFTALGNAGLYDREGIAAARAALKMGGVLAVWAAQEEQKFAQRLREGGFEVRVRRVRGRLTKGGARHTIVVGRKTS